MLGEPLHCPVCRRFCLAGTLHCDCGFDFSRRSLPKGAGPSSSTVAFGATVLAVPVWLVGLLVAVWNQVVNPALLPAFVVLAAFVWVPVAWLVAYRLAPWLFPRARSDSSAWRSVVLLVRLGVGATVVVACGMYLLDLSIWRSVPDGPRAFATLVLIVSLYGAWVFLVPSLVGCAVYLLRERRLRTFEAG